MSSPVDSWRAASSAAGAETEEASGRVAHPEPANAVKSPRDEFKAKLEQEFNLLSGEMSNQRSSQAVGRAGSASSSARSSLSSSSQQPLHLNQNQSNSSRGNQHMSAATVLSSASRQGHAATAHLAASPDSALPLSSGPCGQRTADRSHLSRRQLLCYQKGKKFIQSIPIPLIVTCTITAFILCLIISECKSLNVMTNQASAMQRVAAAAAAADQQDEGPQQDEAQEPEPADRDGLADSAAKWQAEAAERRRHSSAHLSALRREFIAGQLARHQQQMKRHSPASESQQSGAGLESLGAMLLAGPSDAPERRAGGPEVGGPDPTYVDGEPSSEGSPRPAHLRSSGLEVDVDAAAEIEPQALSYRSQPQQQQQQQLGYTSSGQGAGHNLQQQAPQHLGRHHSSLSKEQPQYKSIDQAHESARSPHQSSRRAKNPDQKYDVAQIQCNNTAEGFERFACPTPDEQGRHRCIEDRLFCDGYYDCPGGEDEERTSCMYYRLFVSHIDILTNTFLTWMKKQNRQQLLQQQYASRAFDVGLARGGGGDSY